jgi:phosphinothricin acetyltransferase
MERLRLAHAADGAALAAIYAPSVTDAATSFELTPPTATEMAMRVSTVTAHAPWLVLERSGMVAGFAYASPHKERAAYQWSVDVSVYVGAAHRRSGVARALYGALFALLRAQGFYKAHAGITLPNPASVGLHEAFGFLPVGVYRSVGFKLGAWRDVGWWQLTLRDPVGVPAVPRTVADVQADPAWAEALSRPAGETTMAG